MSLIRTIASAALGLALLASGCGSSSSSTMPAISQTVIETTDGATFSPSHLTVVQGATVRWHNGGTVPHTVTSGASSAAADSPGALFDSQLPAGGTFEFTFTQVGDQPFFCRLHEAMGMTGVVSVTAPPAGGGGVYGGGVGGAY